MLLLHLRQRCIQCIPMRHLTNTLSLTLQSVLHSTTIATAISCMFRLALWIWSTIPIHQHKHLAWSNDNWSIIILHTDKRNRLLVCSQTGFSCWRLCVFLFHWAHFIFFIHLLFMSIKEFSSKNNCGLRCIVLFKIVNYNKLCFDHSRQLLFVWAYDQFQRKTLFVVLTRLINWQNEETNTISEFSLYSLSSLIPITIHNRVWMTQQTIL